MNQRGQSEQPVWRDADIVAKAALAFTGASLMAAAAAVWSLNQTAIRLEEKLYNMEKMYEQQSQRLGNSELALARMMERLIRLETERDTKGG